LSKKAFRPGHRIIAETPPTFEEDVHIHIIKWGGTEKPGLVTLVFVRLI
jgi:hypothetical protein